MLRITAQIKLSTYLKSNFIYFDTDFSNGTPRFTMMFKNCNNCPDKILESCVYFYQDCMEAKHILLKKRQVGVKNISITFL